MFDVVVDVTTLASVSGQRGIGRYVDNLYRALWARAAHSGLLLAALCGRHARLLARATAGQPAAESAAATPGSEPEALRSELGYRWERRLRLAGWARRSGASLLHLPDPYGTPLPGAPPRVVTCHDLIPLIFHREYFGGWPGARAWQRQRDRLRYASALRLIAVSEATKRDLVELVGVPEARVDVVYHGVDHGRFRPEPAAGEREAVAKRIGHAGPFLLYVGAADARKNLPALLRAHALAGLGRELPLVIAGPLGRRARTELERVRAECSSEDRVKLLGYVDDALVPALYRCCLAHVFPSRYEGFGLPVLEAMASGAATLTCRVSSLVEVAGDAALFAESPDAEAIAPALRRLVDDMALRSRLRELGLARAAGFTWSRCAEQTELVYMRALEQLRGA